jgi:hypothetical protein
MFVGHKKPFNANLNCGFEGLSPFERQRVGGGRLEVHNAELVLVTVIYYAVVIIIALLKAVSDTLQATHSIIAAYARMAMLH